MEQFDFGLIGKNISYSFSQKFFEDKFRKLGIEGCSYKLYDLGEISEIESLFSNKNLRGLNVTIPYKEKIIPYLDELSDEAEKIGAVNTVLVQNGKRTGYNTDAYGFGKTLKIHLKRHHTSALILGSGGAAKAVKYVLENYCIPSETVSRKSPINYGNLSESYVRAHPLIIQCTPVGTFPAVDDCLSFPFAGLTEKHLVIDLIYNPAYTAFIKNSAERGAKTVNGYYMLEQQAEKAWEIWNVHKK